jgi:hypothetical protein
MLYLISGICFSPANAGGGMFCPYRVDVDAEAPGYYANHCCDVDICNCHIVVLTNDAHQVGLFHVLTGFLVYFDSSFISYRDMGLFFGAGGRDTSGDYQRRLCGRAVVFVLWEAGGAFVRLP